MKIVVGGQIDKQKVYDAVKGVVGDRATVEIKDDIAAAMAVKTGQADYYFGACKTGGGGALAMAIALLGMNQCATVSMPGKMLSEEEILVGSLSEEGIAERKDVSLSENKALVQKPAS